MSSHLYTRAFKLAYPLYNKLIGRDTFGVAKLRLASQRSPSDIIAIEQLRKLKLVLQNANKHVPFYRDKFREIGFNPNELRSLVEFEALDFFVTKRDIRANPDWFIAENCDRESLTWHRTGGSTGEPVNFATDPATNSASAAAIVQALSWWDIELGEKHAMFWGSPQFIVRHRLDRIKAAINVVRNKLMNRFFVSNYDLNETNIKDYRESLEKFQPVYVRGMPSSLYIFAKTILKQDGPLTRGAPRIVHSACEQLHDWQKGVIEEGFNSTVVNTYGLSELADIAYGAPCGNLHIMDEDVFVELKDFGTGEREVVATQLNNMMSPLIKYRTADIASSVGACECGLGLRTLEGLKGRAHDFIVAPSGKFLHGQLFTHLIVYEQGVVNYQVRQTNPHQLVVSLVTDASYSREVSDKSLRAGIRNYMGESVDVIIAHVEHIALTRSGKHRWIISDVASSIID